MSKRGGFRVAPSFLQEATMIDQDTDWALVDFTEPKKPEPAVKGQCAKCGKHIGKGVKFHEKTCRGSDA